MKNIQISWSGLHFGEEPPISGVNGSGTIFFCGCNLKCVYCQNYQISQLKIGCKNYSSDQVVEMMLRLQDKGAHNINLVSPTIWTFWLKKIIPEAKKKGLKIPVVWNSNAFEEVKAIRELEGLVDVYLPDYKYSLERLASRYSGMRNYPRVARAAIKEMQRQAEDLKLDNSGIAKRGLIVRHLILPGLIQNSLDCLKFIRSLSDNIHLSLLSQYNPVYRAKDFPEINRPIIKEEYETILKKMEKLEFKNGWVQEFGGAVKCLNPDFRKENPFN